MPTLADYAPAEFHSWLEALERSVYEEAGQLRVTGWLTKEPVPFSRRRTGRKVRLAPGAPWGRELFDCGWLLLEGTIPARSAKSPVLLVDVNGELCLHGEDGEPLAGLTSVASSFDFRLGKPGKRVFRLSDGKPGKAFRLWAEAGYNDLFGKQSGDGRIVEARIALCDEEARRLYYDAAFLIDYLRSLPAASALARRVREILREAAASWLPDDPASVQAALRATARFFAMRPGTGLLEVTAAGHAHLDLAWLWPLREGRRKAVRTLATALRNAARYPEYRFSATQAQMFAWIKEDRPGLYRRIVDAVKRGVIEPVGDAWVEADTNIPSGESLIRQIAEGRRFFSREFGTRSQVMFLPDVFGYSAALPQIIKGCGLDYFMTQKLSWNSINRFPHHTFWWEGLDGTRVLTHMLPEETYNSPASPSSLRKVEDNYAEIGTSDRALMLYGIGDGGGGPGEEHLENLRRARRAYGLPSVRQGKVGAFFRSLERRSRSLPSWQGELYLERHQGTLTSHAEIKRCHREAEILLREVEWLLAAGRAAGRPLQASLEPIWHDVLLFQFHDILPGSSIRRVYEEALPVYRARLAELEEIRRKAVHRLCGASPAKAGSGSALAAVNTLPWRRREWVRGPRGWVWCDVPAFSVRTVAARGDAAPPTPRIRGRRVDNGQVGFTLGDHGGIASLRAEAGGIEMVPEGEETAHLRVYRDEGDAWDVPLDYRNRPARRPAVRAVRPFRDGADAGFEIDLHLGASSIRQRLWLRAGSPLVFVESRIDWREPLTLLRVVFPCRIPARRAAYEIQFGWLEREAHENTSWDAARHECPHQQWVDLGNGRAGLAVLNAGKYGSVIKNGEIEMSLLRSVPYPAFDGKGGGSARGERARYSGLERHVCRYALLPHAGTHAEAGVWRHAREFNVPLRLDPVSPPATPLEAAPLFDWKGDGGFDVSALKVAGDGGGTVLRVVRFANGEGTLHVAPCFPVREIWETDMLETPRTRLASGSEEVRLDFRPFEVKTLLFRP